MDPKIPWPVTGKLSADNNNVVSIQMHKSL